jgi:hypothetical protein
MCYECFRAHERVRGKEYWERNKVKIIEKRTKSKAGRQAEINAYQRAQYHKNHTAYRAAINRRYNERYHEDVQFRIARVLKCSMLNYFNKGGTHTLTFVGCSRDMFMDWMRWQCDLDGLNMDDHGDSGWHIDHVVPCASFDLQDEMQQYACYNWTNLRPLPAVENISKSDRLDTIAMIQQEHRYVCYLRTQCKQFDRTDFTVGTALRTTLRKQLRLGTRGNDRGYVWQLLQQAALDIVTTEETWGQSAAKLLQVVIKYAHQLEEIRGLVRACKL